LIDITSPAIQSYYSFLNPLLSGLVGAGTAASYLALLIALIFFTILLSVIVLGFAYIFGWVERKLLARIQSRRGPTYVGKYGFLQNMADMVKLLSKENIVPTNSDSPLFQLTIPFLIAIVFLGIAFIPFSSTFVGIASTFGLVAIFMLLSFMPLIIFLSGWTSGNKFGSISAQRSVAMLLSYEIPLILVIAAVALLAQSYNLNSIVAAQHGIWFIALMPLGFVVFFIVMLAEMERPPFDLREADNELIAGWLTDAGAPSYALALLLDYIRMFFGCAIIVVLFLGGWMGPAPIPAFVWLLLKVFVVAVLIIAIRSVMTRMRIDRLLSMGWLFLLPLSLLNIVISLVLLLRLG
jgi:NADH-quinone oxidoreductase subunit H